MKGLRLSVLPLIFAFFLPTAVFATEIVIPSTFKTREIPKRAPDGTKIKGLAFPSTLVVRRPNGELFVMYGYITAKSPRAVSYSYFRNDKLDITCWTIIDPKVKPDPQGTNECHQGDKLLERMDVKVPREKYGKFKGTIVQKTDSPSGIYTTVMRWKSGGKFPDPQPLIDAFK